MFFISFALFLSFGKPSGIVNEVVGIAISNIEEILIKNNYCKTKNDCTKQEFVLYEATANAIYLNIYNNVNKNTQNEILETVTQLKTEYQKIKFHINFYKYPHIDYTDNSKNKKTKIAISKFKI